MKNETSKAKWVMWVGIPVVLIGYCIVMSSALGVSAQTKKNPKDPPTGCCQAVINASGFTGDCDLCLDVGTTIEGLGPCETDADCGTFVETVICLDPETNEELGRCVASGTSHCIFTV